MSILARDVWREAESTIGRVRGARKRCNETRPWALWWPREGDETRVRPRMNGASTCS